MSTLHRAMHATAKGAMIGEKAHAKRASHRLNRASEKRERVYAREDQIFAEQRALETRLKRRGDGDKLLGGFLSFLGFGDPASGMQFDLQRLEAEQAHLETELALVRHDIERSGADLRRAGAKTKDALSNVEEALANRNSVRGAQAAASPGSSRAASVSLEAGQRASATRDSATRSAERARRRVRDTNDRARDQNLRAVDAAESNTGIPLFGTLLSFASFVSLGASLYGLAGAAAAAVPSALGTLMTGTPLGQSIKGIADIEVAQRRVEAKGTELAQSAAQARARRSDARRERAEDIQNRTQQNQRRIRRAAMNARR